MTFYILILRPIFRLNRLLTLIWVSWVSIFLSSYKYITSYYIWCCSNYSIKPHKSSLKDHHFSNFCPLVSKFPVWLLNFPIATKLSVPMAIIKRLMEIHAKVHIHEISMPALRWRSWHRLIWFDRIITSFWWMYDGTDAVVIMICLLMPLCMFMR